MDFNDIELRMKVRVSPNLTKTDQRFGINHQMQNMRNKTYEVAAILKQTKGIRLISNSGWSYTFDAEDLSIATNTKKK